MLILELQFPAGRYHATPWGRNVNEGDVEWPPSPYRLARAIIDVWKRRKPDWPEERVEAILNALSVPPWFFLPPATAAHTRSFLSSNIKDDPSKKQLIFDAFVVMDRSSKVLMGFDCDLEDASVRDLHAILKELNYFGRSESWVRAGVTEDHVEVEWNCLPASIEPSIQNGETAQVACLLPHDEYRERPYRPEESTWLDALCLTTGDLLSKGWSAPPALLWMNYVRESDALRPVQKRIMPPLRTQFCCAKYALSSKVLPRVQETASFAERIRGHLMGIHKRLKGNDPTLVSKGFSGKERDGTPLKGHNHAWYLPLDEDGDGRLDHLLIFSGIPFDEFELAALDRLRSVWQPNRRPDVNLVLVSLSAKKQGQRSTQWVSTTPFVTARHYRKGRGAYEEWLTGEITRECGFHGMPHPTSVEWVPHTLHTSHPIRWMEFIRSRKNSAPLRGCGCRLSFEDPVSGPFALGACCHFGLGLFAPYEEK